MTRFRTGANVSAKWLAYVLSTPKTRVLLRNIATGTSGSMKNISKAAFLALEFCMPSRKEQTAIATVLSDMDAELAALGARRDKTRALKQGMMQELLTGRTRLV
jgi:restriction endonuclease S subunit